MSNRKYFDEHITWLAENISGCPLKDLTERFNTSFNMAASVEAITSLTNKHGLHNGIDTRLDAGYEPTQFKKGHIPFNKGKKKYWVGGEETQFKKGNKPWNYKPVGTERVNTDGYVDIKVSDPNKWRQKHILIWEEANGSIPKDKVLIFADGDRLHVEIDNLLLVSRKQLARLNQNGLIQNDAELTKSGLIIADIISKSAERKKGMRKA